MHKRSIFAASFAALAAFAVLGSPFATVSALAEPLSIDRHPTHPMFTPLPNPTNTPGSAIAKSPADCRGEILNQDIPGAVADPTFSMPTTFNPSRGPSAAADWVWGPYNQSAGYLYASAMSLDPNGMSVYGNQQGIVLDETSGYTVPAPPNGGSFYDGRVAVFIPNDHITTKVQAWLMSPSANYKSNVVTNSGTWQYLDVHTPATFNGKNLRLRIVSDGPGNFEIACAAIAYIYIQ